VSSKGEASTRKVSEKKIWAPSTIAREAIDDLRGKAFGISQKKVRVCDGWSPCCRVFLKKHVFQMKGEFPTLLVDPLVTMDKVVRGQHPTAWDTDGYWDALSFLLHTKVGGLLTPSHDHCV
jgi:hypothetical protein